MDAREKIYWNTAEKMEKPNDIAVALIKWLYKNID